VKSNLSTTQQASVNPLSQVAPQTSLSQYQQAPQANNPVGRAIVYDPAAVNRIYDPNLPLNVQLPPLGRALNQQNYGGRF